MDLSSNAFSSILQHIATPYKIVVRYFVTTNQWPILYNFLGIIYTTSSIFIYDFDWGYTDSDVITSKKVL